MSVNGMIFFFGGGGRLPQCKYYIMLAEFLSAEIFEETLLNCEEIIKKTHFAYISIIVTYIV